MKNKYVMVANRWWLVGMWLMSIALSAQAQTVQPPVIEWQRVVEDNSPNDRVPAITRNSQGGYSVVTGDRRLLFLTSAGNIVTDTPITGGSTNGETLPSLLTAGLAPTSDGGVVLGVRDNMNWSLQKRDASGALVWVSRLMASNSGEFIYSPVTVVATLDGGFTVFGNYSYRNPRQGPAFVTAHKVDNNGVLIWYRVISYSGQDDTGIIQAVSTPNGGYLLGGSLLVSRANARGWAAKLDERGSIVWQKQYDQISNFTGVTLYPAGNGTYVLHNSLFSGPPNSFISSLLIIDDAGNPTRGMPASVPFEASTSLSSIVALPPTSRPSIYVIANNTPTSTNGGDIRLTSFSDQDNIVWTKTLGGSGRDEYGFNSSIVSTDDGLIIAGTTTSTDGDVQGKSGNSRATWIVKLKNAPPANALTLTQPTYNCQTGAIVFNTTGGDGSPITYNAPGVSRANSTDNFGTVEPGLRHDPKPITITATQNGNTVSYTFDFGAFCNGNQPPTGGPLTLLAPTYDCTTGAFRFNTSGGNGTPIEYQAAPGITGWTTNPNQFVDQESRTATDVKPFTLMARQSGVTVTYVWDLRAVCPNPPAVNPLMLLAPTYDCATGAFRFNTSGGNGTLIEYQAAPGITGWTTNPNQFVDQDSRTANDVKPFTLMARQSGVVVTYVWDLKAACGRSQARLRSGERMAELSASVLGNPVIDAVTVEVRGAEGKPLTFRLIDLRGRLVESRLVEQAGATEQQRFDLHQPGPGLYVAAGQQRYSEPDGEDYEAVKKRRKLTGPCFGVKSGARAVG